jgi:hypothetical protein
MNYCHNRSNQIRYCIELAYWQTHQAGGTIATNGTHRQPQQENPQELHVPAHGAVPVQVMLQPRFPPVHPASACPPPMITHESMKTPAKMKHFPIICLIIIQILIDKSYKHFLTRPFSKTCVDGETGSSEKNFTDRVKSVSASGSVRLISTRRFERAGMVNGKSSRDMQLQLTYAPSNRISLSAVFWT